MDVKKRSLFNENGDVEVSKKRMINGNTTNLNDFNNMKYGWVSEWYRQAMTTKSGMQFQLQVLFQMQKTWEMF